MNAKLLEYIENSFLMSLLKMPSVTDISYNGEYIYYQDNKLGRKKSDIEISASFVNDFIRQIANLSEQQFSFSNPILDISVGRYRINAVHGALVKVNNDRSVSFSIRIASSELKITDNGKFMPKEIYDFLILLVNYHISIVIGGETGSGKTELQKFLISKIEENGRVIIIDNVQELDSVRTFANIDITSWQVNELMPYASFNSLIKNAIRSNPDWLIIAEARGREMSDALDAAMTGHPIITTLHAKDIYSMPSRMARMVMMNKSIISYDEILQDVGHHFHIFVYLKCNKANGQIERYISQIGEFCESTKTVKILYERKDELNIFFEPSEEIISLIKCNPFKGASHNV